jgi:outer membrane protein OmpA-like peptidoglycan-associated protein
MCRSAANLALLVLGSSVALAQMMPPVVRDVSGSERDIQGTVRDINGSVIDMAGKTQDLEVRETATEIRIDLAADVLFDFDKADIKPEAAASLHSAAEVVKGKSADGRTLRIDGYTDSRGSQAYNLKLSQRRAEAVKQWLATRESVRNTTTVEGFGADHPVAANTKPDGSDDPVGRQKNRRVEIVVTK